MQLEQILSAAVAAVNANGMEIESIPSSVECLDLQPKTEISDKCTKTSDTEEEEEQEERKDETPPAEGSEYSGTESAAACDKEENDKNIQPQGADMPVLIPLKKKATKEIVSGTDKENKKTPAEGDALNVAFEVVDSNKTDYVKSNGNLQEINDNMSHPVEVSFFGGEDENLIITSEQALGMFETIEANHSSGVSSKQSSGHASNHKLHTSSRSNSKFDEMKICNDKNFQMEFSSSVPHPTVKVKERSEASMPYEDRPEVTQISTIEEEVVSASTEDDISCKTDVPKASTEVEVVTIDESETVEYTTLTPPLSVGSVSSAVSGALKTISGDVSFHSPPPGSTVDTTMDANGQFVVKVIGPGIDISIPNHELSNQMNAISSISNLECISDKDIIEVLNLGNESETVYHNFNENAHANSNNLESPKNTDESHSSALSEEHKNASKSLKRKRDPTPNRGNDQEEPIKKKHSCVIAALRESIFRSKARKIVNQLGKDQKDVTLNKTKESEKTKRNSPNENAEKVKKEYVEDPQLVKPDEKRYQDRHTEEERNGRNYHFRTHTSKVNPHNHQQQQHCSHRKSYNSSSYNYHSQQSHRHSSPPYRITSSMSKDGYHNIRHSHHSRDHASKHHHNKCRKRCCSPCETPVNTYCKNECCASSRRQRSPSCNCCRYRSEDPKDSFMMVRPEDLPSILRKGCKGNGSPIVMLEPDALTNTDGDSLKVQLVYLVRSASDRRMPREVPSPHSTHSSHSSPTVMPNSPECNGSCTSSYSDSFPSHTSTPNSQRSFQVPSQEFPLEEPKWPETDNYQTANEFIASEKSRQSSSTQPLEDPVAYLHKPIEKWSYADVIFFLMEACNELRINPGGVKFKDSDNGSVLLRMLPSDFEVLAPGYGQKVYDYFINFKTQNYMASGQTMQGPYYTQCAPLEQPHHSHQQHLPLEDIYSSHHYQQRRESLQDIPPSYEHFQPSPCNSSGTMDSHMSEYVPQGSHYMESLSDPMPRRTYDMPTAALKTFPPLHNYDEPLSDPDEIEEETPPEPPKKRGPGRPPKPESERKRKPKKTGRLWEFIRNLLLDPKTCPSLLRWEDAHEGIFRIVQSDAIANKWGMRKNNEKMNYEKLSRAMRYYYKAKIFEPVLGKRLVYKFGSNAKGWRPLNPNNPNFQN